MLNVSQISSLLQNLVRSSDVLYTAQRIGTYLPGKPTFISAPVVEGVKGPSNGPGAGRIDQNSGNVSLLSDPDFQPPSSGVPAFSPAMSLNHLRSPSVFSAANPPENGEDAFLMTNLKTIQRSQEDLAIQQNETSELTPSSFGVRLFDGTKKVQAFSVEDAGIAQEERLSFHQKIEKDFIDKTLQEESARLKRYTSSEIKGEIEATLQLEKAVKEILSDIVHINSRENASLSESAFRNYPLENLDQLLTLACSPAGAKAGIISSVILNAAMIPGWPAPPPFAPVVREEKLKMILKDLLGEEGMDDIKLSEYLANFAVGQLLLKKIKDLWGKTIEEGGLKVLGWLAVLIDGMTSVLQSLQEEIKVLVEEEKAQEAEEEPEDLKNKLRL